ncbi:MAG: hypothetical protein OMM_06043 [Candidatus Magnetoglobus multicellularis str. Araruama]|uniref:Uncharacterized protein n=1 Tax=Candidatus Magnetoglobus multicellularis str. Araruama TaxID=890399 RepID=A0A1V1NS99_9BACT|nr:MAG: hypothetical protein OMM_06043 [Candidatus Magnetoglobus multicellularis str. Araruama]
MSFSYQFWRNVLTGNDLNTCFDHAKDYITTVTMRFQEPQISRYTSSPFYIGHRPLKTNIKIDLSDVYYDERSDLLIAVTESEFDKIWVEMIPPTLEFSERPSNAPVLGFPSVTLTPDPENKTMYTGNYINLIGIPHDVFFVQKISKTIFLFQNLSALHPKKHSPEKDC